MWRHISIALGSVFPGEEARVEARKTRAPVRGLMEGVWDPLDSSAMPRFYSRGAIGHHRRAAGSTQELVYETVADRLERDKRTGASVRGVVAENDRFAVRFGYTANFFLTRGTVDVDNTYFVYPPREGKLSERWLLAGAGFDHKATGAEGTLSR